MMHDYINRRVKHVLDGCSMLSGMLFQLNWNTVPTYLEQESNLAVTRLELKKLTIRANDRFGVNVFISHKMIGEFGIKDDVF